MAFPWVRGTGVDLWCQTYRTATLEEETWLKDGRMHGGMRRWNRDEKTVYVEESYFEGQEHGIFRSWNEEAHLHRGFPRYFVRGRRVDKRTYLRAAAKDPTLPPWKAAEQSPRRDLPKEYTRQPVWRKRRERRGRTRP